MANLPLICCITENYLQYGTNFLGDVGNNNRFDGFENIIDAVAEFCYISSEFLIIITLKI